MLHTAEQFLREIAGDDLDGVGCYCIDWRQIEDYLPGLHRDGVYAYTSGYLPTAVKPWLGAQGRWAGHGFCCLVFRDRIVNWPNVLGCCTHELAHYLADETYSRPAKTDHAEAVYLLANWAADSARPSPPWAGHDDPAFIRAAAHLSHRAYKTLASVRPEFVRFSKQYFGISEQTWLTALGDELDRTGPIRDILSEPPPESFIQLHRNATDGT